MVNFGPNAANSNLIDVFINIKSMACLKSDYNKREKLFKIHVMSSQHIFTNGISPKTISSSTINKRIS